ncbi:VOC family protein [Saccharomonospora iraqiensis]|uniref:VOC family protein n=1 Tax=Saccharomonospora iraqiensis TaxID=52698 RepID=UPI000402E8F9|nr:VOC family protein [Saccharomonospora iraqiensis]
MSHGSPSTPATSVPPPGTPCWVELAAVDEPTARRFYGELFGWDFHVKRDPVATNRRYTLALRDGIEVAGLYQAAPGQPTGWSVHLSVVNAASSVGWVEHLGGTVRLGPVDIPDRGTVLHATDPAGTPVVLWQPPEGWSLGSGIPGTLSGVDLNTPDAESTDGFYRRLFAFTSEQIGRDGIDYAEWRLGPRAVLYRCVLDPEPGPPTAPHWMTYFAVEPARGADATAGHAMMLGGDVITEPYDTQSGRTATLADPDGALFSVTDHSRPVDLGVGRSEVDDPHGD